MPFSVSATMVRTAWVRANIHSMYGYFYKSIVNVHQMASLLGALIFFFFVFFFFSCAIPICQPTLHIIELENYTQNSIRLLYCPRELRYTYILHNPRKCQPRRTFTLRNSFVLTILNTHNRIK